MSIIYRYDGSFCGFLCLLDEALRRPERPFAIITENDRQMALLVEVRTIESDEKRADAFWERLCAAFSKRTARALMHAFLADHAQRDIFIFDYLSFLRDAGPQGAARLAHPSVKPLYDLIRQVTCEAHRLTGLLRFTRVKSGLLVASLEPDHRVLPLIAPHFARRLPNERWLIADIRHQFAYYWDTVVLHEALPEPEVVALENRPSDGTDADPYERLWRRYFQTVAIAERRNPRCQRRFMPERYWKHLTEKR